MDFSFGFEPETPVVQRVAHGFRFSEVGGIISLCEPGNTLYQIDHLRRLNPDIKTWELEESINHFIFMMALTVQVYERDKSTLWGWSWLYNSLIPNEIPS